MRERKVAGRALSVLSIATLFSDATRPNFGIFVEQSLAALARQPGVKLTVVAPLGLPPWPLSLHPRYAALRTLPVEEERNGLRVIRPRFTLWPGMGARRNAAAIARAVLPVAERLRAEGTLDIIDAQYFHPDGHAAQIVAKALDLPYSVKARGSDISLWARRHDVSAQIAATAEGATGMLAVSAALKEDMAALGMPTGRISVHYTGVDRARFSPRPRAESRTAWGLPMHDPLLLTVGTLTVRKGQHLVIDAMTHLPPDVHYAIAGDGRDRAALEQQARALGLADRVHFLGSIANARLPELYSAADVKVLPSASEGLANAWVEALACGTPLVISDIPPAHEMIDSADAGVISAATPLAIAEGILAVLAQPVDRDQLAERTHQRFDWDRNGATLASHLRACVQRFNSAKVAARPVRSPRRPLRHSPRSG